MPLKDFHDPNFEPTKTQLLGSFLLIGVGWAWVYYRLFIDPEPLIGGKYYWPFQALLYLMPVIIFVGLYFAVKKYWKKLKREN